MSLPDFPCLERLWQRQGALLAMLLAGLICAAAVLAPLPRAAAQSKEAEKAEPADEEADNADDAADEEKTEEPKQEGILERLFNPFRTPVARPATPAPGKKTAKKTKGSSRSGDQRAPTEDRILKALDKAREQLAVGEWPKAFEILQKLIDERDDSIARTPGGEWLSVRTQIRQMVGALPPEQQASYRTQYSGVAEQELRAAERIGTLDAFAGVATRYFHTDAGQAAANRLASLHFDRGEYGLAVRWFHELIGAGAPVCRESAWRLKAAFAAAQVQDEELLQALRQGLSTEKSLAAGGARISLDTWLSEEQPDRAPVAQDDWPMLYGNPSRTGRAAGGEPLLIRRWSQPITFNPQIRREIGYVLDDLRDQSAVPLPAHFPLMVDGKLIFRTLQGVRVIDAASGQALWETPDPISAEKLLSGQAPANDDYDAQVAVGPWGGMGVQFQARYYPGQAEQAPLSHLLFRNANYGVQSSDGTRLYVIEDQPILSQRQPGQFWGEDPSEVDQFGRSWSSNMLAVYDLETGRSLWEAGGPELNDPFELPLAGTFFLGAPVASGDDLFLIGEKNNEIRLHVLDPRTGAVRWTQLLAFSPAKIEIDVGRQWFTTQVTVADGVVICPTSVGWLMAVDRHSRSILWAYRYSPPKKQDQMADGPGSEMIQMQNLNQQWSATPPVVADSRVFYTPPESQTLICLDLVHGRKLWQKPRTNRLYLAGVFGDKAVIVGTDEIAALKAADGSAAWKLPLAGQHPAGRGVALADQYLLPLTNGELWGIDLARGRKEWQAQLPADSISEGGLLGNLGMYQGMLISLNPLGLTAFEQKQAIEAAIAARLQKSPDDGWANLKRAESLALKNELAAALESLRKIDATKLDAALVADYRRLMVAALAAAIRTDLKAHDAELAELSRFVSSWPEKQTYYQLRAEGQLARGATADAFETYLELSKNLPPDELFPGASSRTEVRGDTWLSGRLLDLWEQTPAEGRAELDRKIEALAAAAIADGVGPEESFCQLFGFHPAADGVRRNLVEAYVRSDEFALAEQFLLAMQAGDGQVTNLPHAEAWATERLGRLMVDYELMPDAAEFYRQLATKHGNSVIRDEKTGKALVDELRAAGELPQPVLESPFRWDGADLSIRKSGVGYNGSVVQELCTEGRGLPFFRTHRIDLHPNDQRLAVVNVTKEEIEWLQPLKARAEFEDEGFAWARVVGHQPVLLYRGSLQLFCPITRQVVWTHSVADRTNGMFGYNGGHRQPPATFRGPNQGAILDQWQQQLATSGPLCAATPGYVAYMGRRQLVVVDAGTGEVRWRRDGMLPNSLIHGTPRCLYVVGPNRDQALALRVLDGKPLEAPQLLEQVRSGVAFAGEDIIRWQTSNGGQISRRDPLTGLAKWTVALPTTAQISPLSADELIAALPGGEVQSLDLQTGEAKTLANLSGKEFKNRSEMYALADYDNIYLVVNHQQNRTYFHADLPAVPTHGVVYAIDRQRGEVRWKQPITSQNLVLDRLDHSPVLLFAARKYERKGNMALWTMELKAVDKQSGRLVFNASIASQSGFQNIAVNLAENYLELRSYNERIRLSPTVQTSRVK